MLLNFVVVWQLARASPRVRTQDMVRAIRVPKGAGAAAARPRIYECSPHARCGADVLRDWIPLALSGC